jgi:indole-3-glycerol phosphate synthase
MTILDDILKQRKLDISDLKRNTPIFETQQRKRQPLYDVLIGQHTLQIIAEVKRASPSKGNINIDVNPIEQAIMYEKAGAACISVLTEPHFFKGSYADLHEVAKNVSIPVLCKDFIVDEIQMDIAKSAGASVVLLIVNAVDTDTLTRLFTYATSIGLDVLMEVHTVEDLQLAKAIGANIIGVNNRNLKTFDVTLEQTKLIGDALQNDAVAFISESGIQSVHDANTASRYGANALLVGETLMRAEQVEKTLKSLQVPVTKGARL